MKRIFIFVVVIIAVFVGAVALQAEDLNASFTKIEKLVKSGDLPRALNELSWVRTDLEKQYNESVNRFLPDTLADYRAVANGQPWRRTFGNDKSPSRFYAKDPSVAPLRVSIVGKLDQMSKFYALACENSFGNAERIRIGERPASISARDKFRPDEDKVPVTLTVCLSGGQINFEGEDSPTSSTIKNELKKLAEAFKFDEIEKYLEGFK